MEELVGGVSPEAGRPFVVSAPATAAEALGRLTAFFDRRQNRHGWVARRLVGRPAPGDSLLNDQLIRAAKGSFHGAGSPLSIRLVEELIDLEAPAAVVGPGLDWLLGLSGRPGAFGQGCTSARHAHRVCEHFLGGFYSIAPGSQRLVPLTLPHGRTFRVESQARFAVSSWMLRIALRGGKVTDAGVQRHLDSFVHLLGEWELWDERLAPDLAFGALAALAVAPERWRPTLDSLVEIVARHQLPDGTWPRVDFFTALDGLARVEHRVVGTVLERALPGLLQRQREDGSFGPVAADERGLIGLLVLGRLV